MAIENYIIKRYLFSKRKFQFITLINRLSTLGIIIGVAALIIVLSIFNGFTIFTEQKLYEADSHLKIYSFDEKIKLEIEKELINDNVVSFTESQKSKAIISSKGKNKVVELISYKDPDYYNAMNGIKENSDKRLTGLVIGSGIASELKLYPGDKVNIQTPEMIKRQFASYRLVSGVNVEVQDVYRSGMIEQDEVMAIVSWDYSKKIWRGKAENNIEVLLTDPYQAEIFSNNLMSKFPEINIETWKDRNQKLLFMMEFERYASFIIVGLIVVIALFNLFASLSMTVVEKIKDISLLRVMGADSRAIKNIFLKLGIINGVLGIGIGSIIGIGFVKAQEAFGFLKVVDKYFTQAIPVELDLFDVLLVLIYSLLMTYLASSYPASFALEKNPSEGIRFIQ